MHQEQQVEFILIIEHQHEIRLAPPWHTETAVTVIKQEGRCQIPIVELNHFSASFHQNLHEGKKIGLMNVFHLLEFIAENQFANPLPHLQQLEVLWEII